MFRVSEPVTAAGLVSRLGWAPSTASAKLRGDRPLTEVEIVTIIDEWDIDDYAALRWIRDQARKRGYVGYGGRP